jgi:5-methylcytosine-specific restriction endonuclease McrA
MVERAAYLEAHREERLASNAAYHASHKVEDAAYQDTHREETNARSAAWYEVNKERVAVRGAAYREEHKEERAAASAAWYKAHPEVNRAQTSRRRVKVKVRMDKVDRTLSTAYRKAIVHDLCFYCGAPGEEDDHYQSIANGGTDHWWNLVRSCRKCNRLKSSMDGDEFIVTRKLEGLAALEAAYYRRLYGGTERLSLAFPPKEVVEPPKIEEAKPVPARQSNGRVRAGLERAE